MSENDNRPGSPSVEIVRRAPSDLEERGALLPVRSRPQMAWISRLQTKQLLAYQEMLQAEAALADTLLGHQRALGRLMSVEEYKRLDRIQLENELAAAERQAGLRELDDEIARKERVVRLRQLDQQLDGLSQPKKPPKSKGEQKADQLEARFQAEQSVRQRAEEMAAAIRKGKRDEDLSEDALRDIENIRDAARQIIEEL